VAVPSQLRVVRRPQSSHTASQYLLTEVLLKNIVDAGTAVAEQEPNFLILPAMVIPSEELRIRTVSLSMFFSGPPNIVLVPWCMNMHLTLRAIFLDVCKNTLVLLDINFPGVVGYC